jgi:3-phenylpropionate/trans-cinnamate dioxygenase ferredoxin subunit
MSEWVEVADISEFEATDRKLVDLGGDKQIGLFKLPDGFFAVSAWCSHQKSSLVHGDVNDHEIECPLHGARFDLRTGRHLSLPAVRPIPRYDVRVDAGKVLLKIK